MFYKFPSTPYIEVDSTVKRNDKILLQKEVSNLLCNEIIIEEKIDGPDRDGAKRNRGKHCGK